MRPATQCPSSKSLTGFHKITKRALRRNRNVIITKTDWMSCVEQRWRLSRTGYRIRLEPKQAKRLLFPRTYTAYRHVRFVQIQWTLRMFSRALSAKHLLIWVARGN